MKILVLNGSPRKGNTLTAIATFAKGVSSKHELEVVDTYKLTVSPCTGCGACQCYKGCVAKDDSNMIVDKTDDLANNESSIRELESLGTMLN